MSADNWQLKTLRDSTDVASNQTFHIICTTEAAQKSVNQTLYNWWFWWPPVIMELDAMLTRRISPSEPVLGMRPPILGDVYVLILDSQAKSCKYDITRYISSIAIDVATNPKTTSSHSSITMRDFTDHIAVSPQKVGFACFVALRRNQLAVI